MVESVWQQFIERFATPSACAATGENKLFELVAPLGLGRQRASALRLVSVALVERHRGKVPRSIEQLVAPRRVAMYAAHAVPSVAYGQHVPGVDVSVIRVFSRLTGRALSRDNRRAPWAWQRAWRILPARRCK